MIEPVWKDRRLSITGKLRVHRTEVEVQNDIVHPKFEVIDELGTIFDCSYAWTTCEATAHVIKWPDDKGIFCEYLIQVRRNVEAKSWAANEVYVVYASSFEDAKRFLLRDKSWLKDHEISLKAMRSPIKGIPPGLVFSEGNAPREKL